MLIMKKHFHFWIYFTLHFFPKNHNLDILEILIIKSNKNKFHGSKDIPNLKLVLSTFQDKSNPLLGKI